MTTEGDAVHNADPVRAFSGLTGTDVKIGVISNGVDSWDTALASADLPGDLEINPNSEGFGHEGTAMLEIVHDLAPGAQLAFSGGITSLAFVESVLWLANGAFSGEGADIIVDDMRFFSRTLLLGWPCGGRRLWSGRGRNRVLVCRRKLC